MAAPPSWRDTVTDPREIKIFEALEDPQWEWRTLGALARASALSETEVRGILMKCPALVRRSSIPNKSGEELYTLQSRYFARQSPLEKLWTFMSSNTSSSST